MTEGLVVVNGIETASMEIKGKKSRKNKKKVYVHTSEEIVVFIKK